MPKTGGRKAGTPNRATVRRMLVNQLAAAKSTTPLEVLIETMQHHYQNWQNPPEGQSPLETIRCAELANEAAIAAAPYAHGKIATKFEVGPPTEPDADPLEVARRIIYALREAERGMQPQADAQEVAPLPLLPAPPPLPRYTERERTTPDPRFSAAAPIAEAPPIDPPAPEPGPADLVTDPRTGQTMAYRVLQMRNSTPKPAPTLTTDEAIASMRAPARPTIDEYRRDQRPLERRPTVINGRARRVS